MTAEGNPSAPTIMPPGRNTSTVSASSEDADMTPVTLQVVSAPKSGSKA
eukprot:CAMPEP_0172643334 /NCGR_PEP_ID=MMETSP1068-20121228/236502_1 /TAXON_ID=35684 /ORGANISM="Pseudopedinella elastica, Strain CCMP716" /LENGTH=48 /DNA_ID= /DNA_START= /DNA_END= /DNA_ORIENTATION=